MAQRSPVPESGSSLIEVIVAIGVLAVASTTLAALFMSSAGLMTAARHRSYAAILARAKLEELLSAAAAGQPLVDGEDGLDAAGRLTGESDALYVRRWYFVASEASPGKLATCRVDVTAPLAAGMAVADTTLATLVEIQP